MDSTGAGTVRSFESRISRSGRVLKAPRAYVPAPTSSATGGRPRKEAVIVCVGCGRGHSPNTNMIVFCDGCNATWHQKCHDPLIEDHVVENEDAEWHCRRCKPVVRPSPARPEKAKKAKRVHPRTAKGGPRLEVSGAGLSVDKRRAYLSRLSHAALVELAVKVSVENPQVSMFPRDMAVLGLPQLGPPQSASLEASEESHGDENDSSKSPAKRARGNSAPAKGTRKRGAPAEAEGSRKKSRSSSAPAAPVMDGDILMLDAGVDRQNEDTDVSERPVGENPHTVKPESPEPDEGVDPRLEHRRYPQPGSGFLVPAAGYDPEVLPERDDHHPFSHNLSDFGATAESSRSSKEPESRASKRSVSFCLENLESAFSRPWASRVTPTTKSALKSGSTRSSTIESVNPEFTVTGGGLSDATQADSSCPFPPTLASYNPLASMAGPSNVTQAGSFYPLPPTSASHNPSPSMAAPRRFAPDAPIWSSERRKPSPLASYVTGTGPSSPVVPIDPALFEYSLSKTATQTSSAGVSLD